MIIVIFFIPSPHRESDLDLGPSFLRRDLLAAGEDPPLRPSDSDLLLDSVLLPELAEPRVVELRRAVIVRDDRGDLSVRPLDEADVVARSDTGMVPTDDHRRLLRPRLSVPAVHSDRLAMRLDLEAHLLEGVGQQFLVAHIGIKLAIFRDFVPSFLRSILGAALCYRFGIRDADRSY